MLLTRPLVFAGISFLTTALVVSFFSAEISLAVSIILCILIFMASFVFTGTQRIKLAVILLGSLIAALSYTIFAFNEPNMSPFDLQSGTISGVVTDIKPAKNSKTAYTIEVTDSSIESMPTGFRAILYAKSDVLIDYYDTIQIEAKARKITSSPTFNSEQFYRAKGIAMTFSSYETAEVLRRGNNNPLYFAKKLNEEFCNRIDRYVKRPYSGFLKAILLGNDNDIDEKAYNSIVRAGITHVFVVSGLHITMISMMAFFILKLFGCSIRTRSLLTIVLAWGFVAITGFGLSAVRAGIMLTLLMGANLFNRKADSLTSLFLAGIIIVLIHPIAVLDASFLLTFTATLGIILFANPISSFMIANLNANGKAKIAVNILRIAAVTVAVNLAMLPVIIFVFRGISVGGLVANIIIVPLLPVLLMFGILLLCVSFIPFTAGFLGAVIEFLLWFIIKVCKAVASIPLSYIGLNYSFVYLWLVITVVLIIIATVFIRQKQVVINTVLISFAGLFVCFGFNFLYNRDNIEITTINTFDAQSVVIGYNNSATVIAFFDDGRIDVDVESFLRSKNIRRIENYVFTEASRKDISDTEFLTGTTDTYNIYLLENDRLLDYAEDSLKPINGIYPLKLNGGYDIHGFKGTQISVDYFESGVVVNIIAGKTKIAITNSPEIAKTADCTILYYCGKYNEMLTYNTAKHVILLNKFELDRLTDKLDCIKAYDETVSLSVRQNGAYRIN